eukprot:3525830-Prorocentrum_lima.AAC.1
MTSSLVGSEMCIRDSLNADTDTESEMEEEIAVDVEYHNMLSQIGRTCLLYTSDAADDMQCRS